MSTSKRRQPDLSDWNYGTMFEPESGGSKRSRRSASRTTTVVLGVVIVAGVALAFLPGSGALARAPKALRAARATFTPVSQRTDYKREMWLPPRRDDSTGSGGASGSSSGPRLKAGYLYSDLRSALSGGVTSPLVRLKPQQELAFVELLDRVERLSPYRTEQKELSAVQREVSIYSIATDSLIGCVMVQREDGRWRIVDVIEQR
ncbi:MAG: hypothetical protein KDC38_03195 [Planctomycetes bacterium]|nr:hypothetical protein [Planctomycetota bacterium]